MSNADNNLVTGAAATEAAAAAIAGSEEPSIDTILANIRAEADQLQRQGLLAPQLDTAEVNWGAFLPEESALPIKRHYAKSEFLIFEDVNFVNNAYLGVLQRAADETGLEGGIL